MGVKSSRDESRCPSRLIWHASLADAFVQASYLSLRAGVRHASADVWARVVEYIRNQFRPARWRWSALCRLAEMSQSHFSKLFKLSTGLAPHQFVFAGANQSFEGAFCVKATRRLSRSRFGVGFRESGALHNGLLGTLWAMTPRQFQRSFWSRNWWDVPSSV